MRKTSPLPPAHPPIPGTLNPFSPDYVDARCVICGLHEHTREKGDRACLEALRAWEKETGTGAALREPLPQKQVYADRARNLREKTKAPAGMHSHRGSSLCGADAQDD